MPTKPPSQSKSDTARANGAKSRGPKSAATREISSRNSLRHGITACSTILLACESQADFDEMVALYKATHQPATAEEESLVKDMIAARWRIQRLWTAETALIDLEMIRQEPEVEKEFAAADPGILLAAALQSLTDNSRCLSLMSRYESRLQRTHERARKALRTLQEQRKKDAAATSGPSLPLDAAPPSPAVAAPGPSATPDASPQPEAGRPAALKEKRQKRTQSKRAICLPARFRSGSRRLRRWRSVVITPKFPAKLRGTKR